ncbi:unnamed protein product [Camellia sinensis]
MEKIEGFVSARPQRILPCLVGLKLWQGCHCWSFGHRNYPSIALGAFGAIKKGVFVSCSAGNSGPFNTSLSNEAPWILTVSASTLDRQTQAQVVLGNNYQFNGESLFQPSDFPSTQLPLVYAGMNSPDSAFCAPGSLDDTDVKGKVVLCQRGGNIARIDKGQTMKDAGGAAMILMNAEQDGYSILADAHVLPASHRHVNPSKAVDPGLVYDLKPVDYLCGLGYTDKEIALITSSPVQYLNVSIIPEAQLNYPSFSITLGSINQTYTRTVTNVGQANSSYGFYFGLPQGVDVSVSPKSLFFPEVNQQMTYQVTFSRLPQAQITHLLKVFWPWLLLTPCTLFVPQYLFSWCNKNDAEGLWHANNINTVSVLCELS